MNCGMRLLCRFLSGPDFSQPWNRGTQEIGQRYENGAADQPRVQGNNMFQAVEKEDEQCLKTVDQRIENWRKSVEDGRKDFEGCEYMMKRFHGVRISVKSNRERLFRKYLFYESRKSGGRMPCEGGWTGNQKNCWFRVKDFTGSGATPSLFLWVGLSSAGYSPRSISSGQVTSQGYASLSHNRGSGWCLCEGSLLLEVRGWI